MAKQKKPASAISHHYLMDGGLGDGRLTIRLYPETVGVFVAALKLYHSYNKATSYSEDAETARDWGERLGDWLSDQNA
jgi:hypothetical protein